MLYSLLLLQSQRFQIRHHSLLFPVYGGHLHSYYSFWTLLLKMDIRTTPRYPGRRVQFVLCAVHGVFVVYMGDAHYPRRVSSVQVGFRYMLLLLLNRSQSDSGDLNIHLVSIMRVLSLCTDRYDGSVFCVICVVLPKRVH